MARSSSFVACSLLIVVAGCGPTPQQPAQTDKAAPAATKSAETAQQPAVKAPIAAPSKPKAVVDPKEFDRMLAKVVELEEDAQFAEAIKLTREMETLFGDHQALLQTLGEVVGRLREEKRAASELQFAVKSLVEETSAEVAKTKFIDAGEAGRIILRKGLRTEADNVAIEIVKALVMLGDAKAPRHFTDRLEKKPSDSLRRALVQGLAALIDYTDAETLPRLFALVKAAPEKNKDLAAFVANAVRKTGNVKEEKFNELLKDAGAYAELKKLGVLSNIPTDGLVLHLRFDEGKDTTASNAVGAAYSGVVKGTWAPGKFDGAIQFVGAEDNVTIEGAKDLELGKDNADFSVAFWYHLDTAATGAWRSIVHKGTSDGERTFAMWMHPGSNNVHCRISTTANGNDGGDSATQLTPGNWAHLAYVKQGDKLRLYINGVQDIEVTLGAPVQSNTGPIYMGKDPFHVGSECSMDEFCVYTRALTEGEVKAMAGPPQPAIANPARKENAPGQF